MNLNAYWPQLFSAPCASATIQMLSVGTHSQPITRPTPVISQCSDINYFVAREPAAQGSTAWMGSIGSAVVFPSLFRLFVVLA
jgi:hypothetical protein